MKAITKDNNAEASIFKVTDMTEINRRADMIKHHLIGDLLSASGNPLTLNGVFNYLSVLIQLPMMVLLYEERNGKYHYTEHFDFEKTKASRGSLALEAYGPSGELEDFDPKKTPVLDECLQLFPVFETGFFIKVFLLDVGKGDGTPFTELSSLNLLPAPKVTSFDIQQEYARQCIFRGFSFVKEQDALRYGERFLVDVNEKIKDIFSGHIYTQPIGDDGTNIQAEMLVKSEEADEIRNFVKARNEDIKGNWHSLDRLYRRAREASLAIKKIGENTSDFRKQNIPNLLFFLRAYDRESPRANKVLKDGNTFSGYEHNVSFLVPNMQQIEIRQCFEYLRFEANKGEPYIGERYGANWKFEHEGYGNFANSLDKEFWAILMTDTATSNGVQTLIDILNKPVGSQTTSMVDAVFYYGTSMYRLPFRRDGGLGRLLALTLFYEQLSDEQKQKFSFYDLDVKKDAELIDDCLRVVIFFYISRMLAPFCKDQDKKWTKVHLFPIDVAGAVVGSVGSITYEDKADASIKKISLETVSLPIGTTTWNQDFYFFVEIFSAVQRALRQQFRDFQINQLCNVVSDELRQLIKYAEKHKNGLVSKAALQKFANSMNTQSKKIARICPYPAYSFKIVETSTRFDRNGTLYVDTVPIGSLLGLQFKVDQSFDVFRQLYRTTALELQDSQPKGDRSMENILKENAQSLKTKLHERVSLTLETYVKLKQFTSASNGEDL